MSQPVPTVTELPAPDTMTDHELLVEMVTNIRELRATIEPILADPASLLAGMGPMAGVFAGLFAGKRTSQ